VVDVAPVIVVSASAKVLAADMQALREAGYVVVESRSGTALDACVKLPVPQYELRDLFAIARLSKGLVIDRLHLFDSGGAFLREETQHEANARDAYEQADAACAARGKP
jgi:hypothetical protein